MARTTNGSQNGPRRRGRSALAVQIPKPYQLFIVESFGACRTPSEIQKALKDEFGVVLSIYAIGRYRPTRGRAPKWAIPYYAEARQRYLEGKGGFPIAEKVRRFEELNRLYFLTFEKYEGALKDIKEPVQIIENALGRKIAILKTTAFERCVEYLRQLISILAQAHKEDGGSGSDYGGKGDEYQAPEPSYDVLYRRMIAHGLVAPDGKPDWEKIDKLREHVRAERAIPVMHTTQATPNAAPGSK